MAWRTQEESALLFLAKTLRRVVRLDDAYELRNKFVVYAVFLALDAGLNAGFRIDTQEPEWPVAFIELPGVGQVSWHLPQFMAEWDGHTTPEKFERINRFVAATLPDGSE